MNIQTTESRGFLTILTFAVAVTALALAGLARADQTPPQRQQREAALNVLLSLVPWHGDAHESGEEREQLLGPIAAAVVGAAQGDIEMAGALLALGQHETHYARFVLEYRCEDGPEGACDDGDARGFLQVHGWCEGPDAPAIEAQCAARVLRAFMARCWQGAHSGNWARLFAAYGTGGRCSPLSRRHADDVMGRDRTMRGMVERLRQAGWR